MWLFEMSCIEKNFLNKCYFQDGIGKHKNATENDP